MTCGHEVKPVQSRAHLLIDIKKDHKIEPLCALELRNGPNNTLSHQTHPWIPYVGDCKAVDNYLDSKSGVSWLLPKLLNAVFRGISQVLFCSNPLTGLIILAALFYSNITVGLATTISSSVCVFTALLMKQDGGSIKAGLTTYNGVLVGCVTASLWKPIYGEDLNEKIWAFIVICSALSVLVNSGVGTILGKWSLPPLTLPFNILNLLLFVSLMPRVVVTPEDSLAATLAPPPTETEELNWGKVLSGIVMSMGQVFAVESLVASILIYVGVLFYSPLLCLMCVLGAAIGTVGGLCFTSAGSYAAIYTGIWGYNSIISSAAIGGFFFVFTAHSVTLAVANVLLTVLMQQGLVLAFKDLQLPVFTLPFVLSTFIFLSVSGGGLIKVENISFPEMHRLEWKEGVRLKKEELGQVSEEAEKELTQVVAA